MSIDTNYATDYNLWTQQTVKLLREHRWQEIDLENLLEEIEYLGKRERRAITSQLIHLLLHLLKWQYQPQKRSDSWLDAIADSRLQIELALKDSPSLKAYPSEQLNKTYQRARQGASKQTGLPLPTFPEECPYLLESVLNEDWLPN
ncbi:MAG: DUF29 domain-containing protein [Cyanobacteria bacterium P01_F01_bin.143]